LVTEDVSLIARDANLDDEGLIMEWANDPAVRRNSFNPTLINAETHRNWFYACLRKIDDCKIYIVETDLGLPIGQVRFDRRRGEWEIDFSLAREVRGLGLGKRLLQKAMQKLTNIEANPNILARVKCNNFPSQRVFESLNYKKIGSGEVVTYMMRL
jgi:UDP-2,4-diacetamido-2,4,6-trideoxy-beta-L-altropyranose hydrolase